MSRRRYGGLRSRGRGVALDLEKLFRLQQQGKLTLDQKSAIVAQYGMQIPRRELARSIMDVVGGAARKMRRDQTEAMANATADQLRVAAAKVLDKYVHKAEQLFKTEQLKKAAAQKLAIEKGEKAAAKLAKRLLYAWLTVGDKNVCPQCVKRQGWAPKTWAEWKALGLPGEGFTYCGSWCRCQLTLAPYQPWDGGAEKAKSPAGKPVGTPLEPEAMARVHQAEKGTEAQNFETAVAFDDDGNVAFRKDGEANQVRFTLAEVEKVKGKVFTHNHPNGTSLSPEDVSFLYLHDLKEIRAIGRPGAFAPGISHEHAAMIKVPEGMTKNSLLPVIGEEVEAIDAEVRGEFMKAMAGGKMSVDKANLLHWHEVWTRLDGRSEWFFYRRIER